MKKRLFLLICVTDFLFSFSQVKFCPPGAEWHYLFNSYNLSPSPSYENEMIKYTGDSIIGLDTLKVLIHKRFFWRYNSSYAGPTLIKQKGDTIFMRNKFTQDAWQILYNFAAIPGQGWSIIINNPTPKTYSFTVTSVTNTIINGQMLKILEITGSGLISLQVTERLGSSGFLFPFIKGSVSDGDYLSKSLCYRDDAFGELKYTEFPCDYSNPVGLNELNNSGAAEIFPNPFSSELTFKNLNKGIIKLITSDGKEVLSVNIDDGICNQAINTESLPCGFYYAKIYSGSSFITKKLQKE